MAAGKERFAWGFGGSFAVSSPAALPAGRHAPDIRLESHISIIC